MSRSAKKQASLGFKQLFDEESSTFTYLLWDVASKDAILIDPVDIQVDRDLKEVNDAGLKLKFGINTHAHADHITGEFLWINAFHVDDRLLNISIHSQHRYRYSKDKGGRTQIYYFNSIQGES